MKKGFLLLVVAIFVCILMIGCEDTNTVNTGNTANTNTSNSNTNNNKEILINWNRMSYEKLVEENYLPENQESKHEYDLGKIRINSKTYTVKYYYELFDAGDGLFNDDIVQNKLVYLYDENNVEKMKIPYEDRDSNECIKEISLFKNKYLVLLAGNQTNDSMQKLFVYDENLNEVGLSNVEEGLVVNALYENFYVINNDSISYIYTKADKRIEGKILENESGELYIEEHPAASGEGYSYKGLTYDSVL